MNIEDNTGLRLGSSTEEKSIMVNLGQGITIIAKNVRKATEEIFDEIAAAIIAIKMYLRTRRNNTILKKRSKNVLRNKGIGLERKDSNKTSLWMKTWLKEVMNEFDFNPYCHFNTLKRFP